jgi:hypothetical protein
MKIIDEFNLIVEKDLDNKIKDCLNALERATPIKTGKAKAGWRRVDRSIINNVDYIDQLNQGASKQAPRFFVERALEQVPGVTVIHTPIS